MILNAYNDPDGARRIMNKHYGYQLSWEETGLVRQNLINAIAGADMLGLPFNKEKVGGYWAMWEAVLDEHAQGWRDKQHCSIDVHNHWLDKGYFEELLMNQPTLNYISCRNLKEPFQRHFRIMHVKGFHIAPEAQFTDYEGVKHYPKGYMQSELWIEREAYKGGFALVGAGFTGKMYLNWLRDQGCVAFDAGNVMDAWAGFLTRGPERGKNKTFDTFKL
jgi:hypothetical protein